MKPVKLLKGGLEPANKRQQTQQRKTPITLGNLKPRRLLALDTETTGLDMWHGCRPFFVSVMDNQGTLQWWEWDVNPLTRNVGFYSLMSWHLPQPLGKRAENSPYGKRTFIPSIPTDDREKLTSLLSENDFVLHNTKFDTRALEAHGLPRLRLSHCHDTLIASHCLLSNESHKLKDLATQYLDIDANDQVALRDATKEARSIARSLGWAIAEDGSHPHFPAQRTAPKDGWWVYDTWLPRAVARYKWEVEGDATYIPPGKVKFFSNAAKDDPKATGHPWWSVLKTYALRDVERTYPLWLMFKEQLEEQELWDIYLERRKLLESTYVMETHGVTVSKGNLTKLMATLAEESEAMRGECFKVSGGCIDNLNSPKQLQGVLFGNFGLRPSKQTKNRAASTDAETLTKILERLEPEAKVAPSRQGIDNLPPKKNPPRLINTNNRKGATQRKQPPSSADAYKFVWNLLGYRAREKSNDYLEEYALRGVPNGCGFEDTLRKPTRGKVGKQDFIVLHPSFNPTGSDTLRFSSSGPNAQNIGKGGKRKDDPVPSLRSVFGPCPGREWYSIDYSNIELRIFAYQSGEQSLIDAYEHDFAVHCIFAELLFPKEYAECRAEAKARLVKGKEQDYDYTLRMETEHIFSKEKYKNSLYQWTKNGDFALIYGAGEEKADTTYHRPGAYRLIRQRMPCIDTFMIDKHEEAKIHGYITTLGGYKLWVPPREPHVAVNYFVQGSAGWCMVLAINRVHAYLDALNSELRKTGELRDGERGYEMIMTIHDELDFDFPIHPRNAKVIQKVGRLMASSGDDIGVPAPVSIEHHPENWSKGNAVPVVAV